MGAWRSPLDIQTHQFTIEDFEKPRYLKIVMYGYNDLSKKRVIETLFDQLAISLLFFDPYLFLDAIHLKRKDARSQGRKASNSLLCALASWRPCVNKRSYSSIKKEVYRNPLQNLSGNGLVAKGQLNQSHGNGQQSLI
ncbi:MAG: hypothetical protein KK926_08315 [Methanomethylovorans sp.]|nr:hypothetical protein [Methanomethylovorans sp.]